ncbi:hypothetical protein [Brevundimonas diminuta]|uniref:Uncharacterized protein n=1 Tax=Brevundimonas diminuta TaxID=293 RepID=A0A2X1CDI4_BREDI|nr:hypothetical protein [Brevundimonas diminuta]SPU46615.1 Uncharacterised protein [Brevundimonas diminuta]
MEADPKSAQPKFWAAFFPNVHNPLVARRVIARHWGGWLFAAANALTATLVWSSFPGVGSYAGYEKVAAAYFAAVAVVAGGLTWLLTRHRNRWAGRVLIALVVWSIVMAFTASPSEGGPPSGPFLVVRFWIALSVVNALRACGALKLDAPAAAPPALRDRNSALALVSIGQRLTQWRRALLFASACWIVTAGFCLALFDPHADIVDGDVSRIWGLLFGPPLLVGIGVWAYRRFVVAQQPPAERTISSTTPTESTRSGTLKFSGQTFLVGVLAVILCGVLVGLGWILSERTAYGGGYRMASDVPKQIGPAADAVPSGKTVITPDVPPALLAPQIPSLDAILAFEDARQCRPGPQLVAVLEALTRTEGDQILPGKPFRIDGYSGLLRPTYRKSEDGLVISTLPLTGTWHGLRVSQIYLEVQFHTYFEIRFSEPPERVRAVLNQEGFVLPVVGERQVTSDPDAFPSWQAVIDLREGGALACF